VAADHLNLYTFALPHRVAAPDHNWSELEETRFEPSVGGSAGVVSEDQHPHRRVRPRFRLELRIERRQCRAEPECSRREQMICTGYSSGLRIALA
jgi:hypothetical protein